MFFHTSTTRMHWSATWNPIRILPLWIYLGVSSNNNPAKVPKSIFILCEISIQHFTSLRVWFNGHTICPLDNIRFSIFGIMVYHITIITQYPLSRRPHRNQRPLRCIKGNAGSDFLDIPLSPLCSKPNDQPATTFIFLI